MTQRRRPVSILQTSAHGIGKCIIVSFLYISCAFVSGPAFAAEITANGFDNLEDLRSPPKTILPGGDLAPDRAVKYSLHLVTATLALWESDHFTVYLFVVSALAGLGAGIIAALLAHYGADPRASWKNVRKKTTWLSAGCGLGVAIFLVSVVLSVPTHGRFSYLVLSGATCASGAALACLICFNAVRGINRRRAARSGLMFREELMKNVVIIHGGAKIQFASLRTRGPAPRSMEKD